MFAQYFPAVNSFSLSDAAIAYALHGIPVFPCTPGAKTPLVKWSEQATTNIDTIRTWWSLWPNANIGMPLGNGVQALDIDTKNGGRGWESYIHAGGEFVPAQPTQITPSGGRHLFFRDFGLFSNFARRGEYGGLDMRTDGGYVLVAPSVVGGRPYTMHQGDLDAPIPAALTEALIGFSTPKATRRTIEMPAPSDLLDFEVLAMIRALGGEHTLFLESGITAIGDNSRQAYRACWTAFRRHGWTLADMVRIGPETILAWYGAEPPHSAPDPWAWAWKYTVVPAWESAQAELSLYTVEKMFQPLEGSSVQPPAPVDVMSIRVPEDIDVLSIRVPEVVDVLSLRVPRETSPGGSPVQPPARMTYENLYDLAAGIPAEDLRGVQAFVLRVKQAGILPEEEEALWAAVKRFSGFPLQMLRDMAKRLDQAVRAERKATQDAHKPAPPEVFVRDQNRIYNPESGQLITKEAFGTAAARSFNGEPVQALQFHLHDRDTAMMAVESLTYDPALPTGATFDARGVKVFNMYRPPTLAPIPGDVSPWLSLLESMKPEGGKQDMDEILDKLAFMIQKPGEKINHGMLFGGAHGIGKDSFLAPVIDCVGPHNTNHIHGAEISSSFTSWLRNAKLIILNEVDYGDHKDRRSISEILKPALAAPPTTLRINEKNIRPYDIPNRAQLIGQTNHRNALYLDDGERRWACYWFDQRIPKDADNPIRIQWNTWFEKYWQWLDNGGRSHVLHFLMTRDISHFQPGARPRETSWFKEMCHTSRSAIEQWILEGLESRHGVFSLPIVDIDTLYRELQSVGGLLFGDRKPSKKMIRDALDNLKIQKKRTSGASSNGRFAHKPIYFIEPMPKHARWTHYLAEINTYCRKAQYTDLLGPQKKTGAFAPVNDNPWGF